MIFRVLYIPGGAGFLPSTVVICPEFHVPSLTFFQKSIQAKLGKLR